MSPTVCVRVLVIPPVTSGNTSVVLHVLYQHSERVAHNLVLTVRLLKLFVENLSSFDYFNPPFSRNLLAIVQFDKSLQKVVEFDDDESSHIVPVRSSRNCVIVYTASGESNIGPTPEIPSCVGIFRVKQHSSSLPTQYPCRDKLPIARNLNHLFAPMSLRLQSL